MLVVILEGGTYSTAIGKKFASKFHVEKLSMAIENQGDLLLCSCRVPWLWNLFPRAYSTVSGMCCL